MAGRPEIVRGLDLVVYINGRIFSAADGLGFRDVDNTTPTYGIDVNRPQELASGQTLISGTLECWRRRNTAGLEGDGINPSETGGGELSRYRYCFIQVVDRLTDTVVLQIPQAKIVEQEWNAKSRSVMHGSFSFIGIGWANEY